MRECWAVMIATSDPLGLSYDGAFVQNSPLSWIARNNSKPARDGEPETWVIHASPEWSHNHIELAPEKVEELLFAEFAKATATSNVGLEYRAAHRWRFALPTEPLVESCLFDADLQLGACGDWCAGPRVEGAFLSGLAIAERLIKEIG